MLPHAVDIDYQMENFLPGPVLPDRQYMYRRIGEATVSTVADGTPTGVVLDVGSGGSKELVQLAALGWRACALDPSTHMLGFSRLWSRRTGHHVHLARGIGERLPFADGAFDRVVCQEALDHFAAPVLFMREVARVLRPDGRAVISLHNFGGLSTRIGRLLHPLARASRLHRCAEWPCWQMPNDHTFEVDWQVVRGLGGESLTLERAYGVSMLCMLYGWGHLLARLPSGLSRRLLRAADGVAYRYPALSDVIVSVWRPLGAQDGASAGS